MFNLEKEITTWRAGFEKDSAFSDEDLDELEVHLREVVDEKIAEGQELTQAFEEAVAQIGELQELRPDFQASQPWPEKLFNVFRLAGGVAALFLIGISGVWVAKTKYTPMLYADDVLNGFGLLTLSVKVLFISAILLCLSFIKDQRLRWFLVVGVGILALFNLLEPVYIYDKGFGINQPFYTSFWLLILLLFVPQKWMKPAIWAVIGICFWEINGATIRMILGVHLYPQTWEMYNSLITTGAWGEVTWGDQFKMYASLFNRVHWVILDPIIGWFVGYGLLQKADRRLVLSS